MDVRRFITSHQLTLMTYPSHLMDTDGCPAFHQKSSADTDDLSESFDGH